MPSRILSIPFVLLALVFLYLTWEIDSGYSLYIIPWVLALALIYVLSPQINWWWYRRRPPAPDPRLRQLLMTHDRLYQSMPVADRQRFGERLSLFVMATEFMAQGIEDVPEDVKGVVAAGAVTLTLGQDDFLLGPFEHVVIYPHPFPSPQFPEHLHASELFEEDGVLLFSVEHLMRGFLQPRQYYNLALHEYAKVYVRLHPDAGWPELPPDVWEALSEISGFSREAIVKYINLPEAVIPARAVSISHFFVFPDRFGVRLPQVYEAYRRIFRVDPETGEVG